MSYFVLGHSLVRAKSLGGPYRVNARVRKAIAFMPNMEVCAVLLTTRAKL